MKSIWGDDKYCYAKVVAIGRFGGIITIWDGSVFYNTLRMGDKGYLVVIGLWKGKDGLVGLIKVYRLQYNARKEISWRKLSVIIDL